MFLKKKKKAVSVLSVLIEDVYLYFGFGRNSLVADGGIRAGSAEPRRRTGREVPPAAGC